MIHATLALGSIHTEHAVLCRNLGAVQERCSRIFAEQSARIAVLQAQVFQLRAQAMLLTTQLAWPVDTSLPLLHHPVAKAPQAAFRPGWTETNEVLCRVACLSHGGFWLGAGDQCLRSASACAVRVADEALQRSGACKPEESIGRNKP